VKIRSRQLLSGGDISRVERVILNDGRTAVLKTRPNAQKEFFAAEAHGLDWLRQSKTLRLPEVLELGQAYLLLEWLAPAVPSPDYDERLGRGLAELHRPVSSPAGLDRDNYVGSLPQSNLPSQCWLEFYCERRLRPLAEKAIERRLGPDHWRARFNRLFERLPGWLPDEQMSRLHGDLWSGNVLVGPEGQPCLIDPAVYVGHREVDLAMMRLFGGFSQRVFSAYQEALPLLAGAAERVPLYQLYPLLVHVHLFGGGYVSSVESALGALP
jgi:protein-ribulosamine 3-kinase